MTELTFFVLIFLCSAAAGLFGSLSGLGGGSLLTPLLLLGFGVDLRYAIGASLVSVIATSSGAAAAFVREGFTNMRVGMFLELATTTGAIVGAIVAAYMSKSALLIIFGLVMLQSAWQANRPHKEDESSAHAELPKDKIATALHLNGTYPSDSGLIPYNVTNVPGGLAVMFTAGAMSGLLGIGSGPLKVLAMDTLMKLPFKVSTTTSNFMIGVTAAASAGVYLNRGYIDPVLSTPVMLGVLAGSLVGARLLPKVKNSILRKIFAVLVLIIGVQMLFDGITGVRE